MYNLDSFYYLTDHLGSIRSTIEEGGGMVSARDYYPFGEVLRSHTSGGIGDRYQFTEKERDQETGLDYFGRRYYANVIGRWLVPDRFADKYPGLSPYSYAANNPIRYIDVNGDSIWTSINEETGVTTIHYQGKLYNMSGYDIDMEKAAADIAEQVMNSFSGKLEDGTVVEVDVDLTVAESMSDVKDSDHLLVIVDKLEGGRGWTPDLGHKTAYLDSRSFRPTISRPLSWFGRNNARSAAHEVGHQMGLVHEQSHTWPRNLMRSGGYGGRLSNAQRIRAINFIDHGRANRGPNSFQLRLGQPPIPWPPPPRR